MTTKTTPKDATELAPAAGIRVYNTLNRSKEPFQPVEPGKVGIYLCGPTVYDRAHIGHMVGPVIFDCIKRYLTYSGYDVTWVVNITDVDDKLINKASERGISMAEVAEENTADYLANLAALGVDTIDHYPKATEHMQQILDFTQSLVKKGFAYKSEGDVYFEVGKDAEYGKLTNRSVDDMEGEGGGAAARKRSPGDFALWKSAKPGEPSWESPWGPGRPGWHIECSAMSRALLGETFDIHGGGLDLIFPHHENEIAQSECCHGQPMAKVWMHNGLLRAGAAAGKLGGRGDREGAADAGDAGGKMSRSKGAGGLAELIERQGGERIRFFLLRTHYRSTVLFSEEAIDEAGAGLDTFGRFFRRYERITGESFYDLAAPQTRTADGLSAGCDATLARVAELRGDFLAAMDDDFNTGGAIGALFELLHLLNKFCEEGDLEGAGGSDTVRVEVLRRGSVVLRELAGTLGLFRAAPTAAAGDDDAAAGPLMALVIELRAAARAAKDFATADRIRDALTAAGIALEDRAGGTEWEASGGDVLPPVMELLIELRAAARDNKEFATADRIRDTIAAAGITLEDRTGGTEWTRG